MEEQVAVTNENSTPSLDSFAALNPESTIETEEDAVVISKPWGDDTLTIRVSKGATALAEALNRLRLPPRFSAIWHTDSKDIEFIFAPLSVTNPLRNRKFTFAFGGKRYLCEFADASDVLIPLANAARPIAPQTSTDYRNLLTVRTLARIKKRSESAPEPVEVRLTSFWIRNCDLPEPEMPEFARLLNFYMVYFDRSTSRIIVHEEPVKLAIERPKRFLFGPFPDSIAARPLDPYMLILWESAHTATEPVRGFLYNYQILEYAAFYYLKEDLARAIRRIVSTPDIVVRSEEASRRILDALVEERTSEEAKIASVVQHAVDPTVLWSEIETKAHFFGETTEFDGGFSLPALIREGWTLEDFRNAWIPKLPDSFRKLRNALLHARERRMAKCVAPTARNQHLLRPWNSLIAVASSQVILFGDY